MPIATSKHCATPGCRTAFHGELRRCPSCGAPAPEETVEEEIEKRRERDGIQTKL
jgi:rRNA maturation endonuclease Nob1